MLGKLQNGYYTFVMTWIEVMAWIKVAGISSVTVFFSSRKSFTGFTAPQCLVITMINDPT